jgi:hypothetical protein
MGCGQRPLDQRIEHLDMGAGGDLRHDAAEGDMLVDLRFDLVGQDDTRAVAAPQHHSGGRFITGGLNSQHAHGPWYPEMERMVRRSGRRSPPHAWLRSIAAVGPSV